MCQLLVVCMFLLHLHVCVVSNEHTHRNEPSITTMMVYNTIYTLVYKTMYNG